MTATATVVRPRTVVRLPVDAATLRLALDREFLRRVEDIDRNKRGHLAAAFGHLPHVAAMDVDGMGVCLTNLDDEWLCLDDLVRGVTVILCPAPV